jgi:hypothetical protein
MKFLASPRVWLLAALCLLPMMVSNDSLWLDEGDTAMYVMQPDFHAWWDRLRHDGQADCQMPLALLCSWVAGKWWGVQEWQLRALNLLWGALALVGMQRVGRRLQLPWLPMLLAIQPYFWFYTNEARPYALQLAGGTGLLLALVEFYFARAGGTAWAWLLAVAGFFLFCATLLAPLPVAMTLLAGGFIAWRSGWRLERRAVLILLGGLMACIPVGIYYLTTLLRGARGAQVWPVDLKFLAYIVYEFTGLGGLGLSEAEIRQLARSPHLLAGLSGQVPQLLLPALTLGLLAALFFCGLRRCSTRPDCRRLAAGLGLVLGLTAAVLVVGSLGLQKAFWARHYAPVFPFYVALLGLGVTGLWTMARPAWRWLPVLLGGLLVFSALNFRFAPALRKEDYRSAAQFARRALAENKSVWWLAGGYSAHYYGLDYSEARPEPGRVFTAFRSSVDVRQLPLPAVVVCNRPDIHDPGGVVGKIIAQHDYRIAARFQSFVIWTNAGQ